MSSSAPGTKKIRFTYGPLELKPANVKRPPARGKMDPNSDQFMGVVTGVPTGVLVVATNSSLTYEDGSLADVVNGVYNHHLIFSDAKRNGPTPFKCVDGGATIPDMGLLMGASEANRDLHFYNDGKIKTGFKLDKNDPITLSAELVNYTNDTKKVYTITDFEYMEIQPADARHVSMQVFPTSPIPAMQILRTPARRQERRSGPSQARKPNSPNQAIFSTDGATCTILASGSRSW